MKRMPILTSGRLLVRRGEINPPYSDPGSDWAALAVVEVSEGDAALLGEYWASGHRGFLATGDREYLSPFDGLVIDGLPLITDPRLIEEFDDEYGYVDVREIYEGGL